MSPRGWVLTGVALLLCGLALFMLERPRWGLEITHDRVGQTPVTIYAKPSADGPLVIVAHGFAGSRQLMQAYSLTLAQAGYRVAAFDFRGHGQNPVPMSGDVTAIDGTTRLLVTQTLAVLREMQARTGEARIALLGHSMASDIIIRTALKREPQVGPIVAISPFSGAVSATKPENLLMISGAWEARLRAFGVEAVQMVHADAGEGQVVTAGSIRRATLVAPGVEHVGILYSGYALQAARDWLDDAYARQSTGEIARIGPWLVLLLASLVLLSRPATDALLERTEPVPALLTFREKVICTLVPMVAAPLLAPIFEPRFLPVLVADYLAMHLALYGIVQLGLLYLFGVRPGRVSGRALLFLLVWGLGLFGLALNRYGANFTPDSTRLIIIAALCFGAVPFMLADAQLAHGLGLAGRILARLAFFASLGIAVALDFEGLFFLLLIAPVIALFFLTFGLMGRWAAARSGASASGLALGIILAWSLGVTFPLFEAGGVA